MSDQQELTKKEEVVIEREKKRKATEALKEKQKLEKQTRMKAIVDAYSDLAEKLQRRVKMTDLIDMGGDNITPDMVKHHFRNLSRLEEAARDAYPDKFHDVALSDLLGPKALHRLSSVVGNYKRYVITTAVTGCVADIPFLDSIKNYCKRNNAALLVLIASDPAHNLPSKDGKKKLGSVDKSLLNDATIVMSDAALNNNVYLSTIKLSAKHIDPITSLGRIGQRNGSFIYASPKQRMKCYPVSNEKFPHVLMTTGAITKPSYTTENYMSERTAYIAAHDHVMGAIILEIEDDETFHYRQIQADDRGSFIDLAVQYDSDGNTSYCAPAIALGDWHSGSTDPTAKKAWEEIIDETGATTIFLHDGFDGRSINHHERKNNVLRAQRAMAGEAVLSDELDMYAKDLDYLAGLVDELVIVKSNHDEVLIRYLMDGYYVKDPLNHRLALDLAAAAMDGHDPLQWYIQKKKLKNWSKIRWLSRDEDYFISQIQMGAHGDKGCNGARGSLRSMENAYGNSVTGHSHTPEILRGAWQVGTSSFLKLSYNVGPSSWFHTSCLVYQNGSRQLINSIEGDWRLATDSYTLGDEDDALQGDRD
jgi:hypothetical protein